MNDADVIIVGCGPVGAMAALRCAQRGLRVIAIDRERDVYPLPRALAIDAEVQDLFARAGLIESLRAASTELLGVEFIDGSQDVIVRIERDPGVPGPLGHPPMVSFDQPTVEAFLREAAHNAGVELRLGENVIGLRDSDGHVDVELDSGATLTSRWVIGADGAKSTVRDLVGLRLIDQRFDQTWLVIDTTLVDPDLDLPALPQQICDPDRIITFVPGHDTRRRWEFRLNPGETREQALDPDFLWAQLGQWGSPEQLRVDRTAVYRFHATVANRFSHGSVFLAGDAAHQMPPFNGQGMCTGMRDAENLAWKLASVADGFGGDPLLATYDQERRPHAEQQVVHSVDTGKLMEAIATDQKAGLQSGHGRRSFPKLEHGLIDNTHPFGGLPLIAPADGTFTIDNGWSLVRGPEATDEIPELWHHIGASVHAAASATFGHKVDDDCTIVVRPDRFVAAVTTDLAPITKRFAPLLTSEGPGRS